MSENKVPENPADKPTTAKSPWLAGTNYSVRGEHGEVVFNTFTRRLALVAPNGGQIDVMGARYARQVEEALAVGDEPEAFALLSAHYRTELAGGAR